MQTARLISDWGPPRLGCKGSLVPAVSQQNESLLPQTQGTLKPTRKKLQAPEGGTQTPLVLGGWAV